MWWNPKQKFLDFGPSHLPTGELQNRTHWELVFTLCAISFADWRHANSLPCMPSSSCTTKSSCMPKCFCLLSIFAIFCTFKCFFVSCFACHVYCMPSSSTQIPRTGLQPLTTICVIICTYASCYSLVLSNWINSLINSLINFFNQLHSSCSSL